MDLEQAKEYAKGQLESYLSNKGINTRKNFKCLVCHGGDKTPPMSYKNDRVHCFSCGFDGDIFDLIGEIKGISDTKDKFEVTYEELNIPISNKTKDKPLKNNQSQPIPLVEDKKPLETKIEPHNYKDYIEECSKRVKDTDYFIKRGLSASIINKFKLGYDPNKKAVIIPMDNYYYTQRSVEGKRYTKLSGIKQRLFNYWYFKRKVQEPIFIVEGEFDALSIEEVGGRAIGLLGVQNINQLVKEIKQANYKPLLIINFDNDEDIETRERVDKAYNDLKAELDKLEVFHIRVNVNGTHKDPNEALIKDREIFKALVDDAKAQIIREVEAEKEAQKDEYLKNNSVSHHINKFMKGIADSVNTPAIPTKFNNLDRSLDGGFFEGLYIIGAISSLGKTTFVLQIADQIAQQGHDVLVFSLEMARTELMAKSISRLTLLNTDNLRDAKTTRGITEGKRHLKYSREEKDLINKSILKYNEYAENMFISEGIGNIGVVEVREAVRNHIEITGKTPVVIVDYIQILAPLDPRASDKQNTDASVLELKRISRDYKTTVLGISSLNRSNYTTEINMAAFKESGAIEYSSDVLLGLQYQGQGKDFDLEEAANRNPRLIELKILKNRNGGRGKVLFEYYPLFNYFKENGNNQGTQQRGNNRW